MRIGVPRESADGERRVALVPESVGRLVQGGFEVEVEPGAGTPASFTDEAYAEAGATVGDGAWDPDAIVKVQKPSADEAARLRDGQVLIAFLQPLTDRRGSSGSASAASSPSRWSRSRGSRARSRWTRSRRRRRCPGYKAALLARRAPAAVLPDADDGGGHDRRRRRCSSSAPASPGCRRSRPRAGSARSCPAFDVRPVVREQVESLGATFLDLGVVGEETEGGYARELTPEEQAAPAGGARRADPGVRRRDHDRCDPGPPAPRLIPAAAVETMRRAR